jgi:hypothetical protein
LADISGCVWSCHGSRRERPVQDMVSVAVAVLTVVALLGQHSRDEEPVHSDERARDPTPLAPNDERGQKRWVAVAPINLFAWHSFHFIFCRSMFAEHVPLIISFTQRVVLIPTRSWQCCTIHLRDRCITAATRPCPREAGPIRTLARSCHVRRHDACIVCKRRSQAF